MSVRYHSRRGKSRSADYCCKGPHANLNRVYCQSIPGDALEARQRYLAIDPHHRLVAEELEAHWNDTIGTNRAAQATYEQQRAADQVLLSEQQPQSIRELCNDFPAVWNNPATPDRERKRIICRYRNPPGWSVNTVPK